MGRRKKESPASTLWRIGLYIRLSREDGGGESESVTNQRTILLQWLSQSFREPYEIADTYIDDGVSGTTTDRAQFQRLLADIEDGRVNCVVCKTLSRVFRNYTDQGEYLESYFPRRGVRFIATGFPFVDSFQDPEAVHSGLEIPINGILNDRYAAKTSADIRRTLDAKRQGGQFIGAFAPYGYRKDPADKNHLLPDEEAAAVVRDIFRLYARDGLSIRAIAAQLTRLGVENPARYKAARGLPHNMAHGDGIWHSKTVRGILANRVYIGDMVQGRQRVVSYKVKKQIPVPEAQWFHVAGTHQPLVALDLFERAQRRLQTTTRAAPGHSQVHLFAGLLRCADCGKALSRRSSAGRHVYYACRTHLNGGHCFKHTIRHDHLEQAVRETLRLQLPLIPSLAQLAAESSASPTESPATAHLSHTLASKQREQAKITTATAALYADLKSGFLSEHDYTAMKAVFAQQAQQLEQSIAALHAELQTNTAHEPHHTTPSGLPEALALPALHRDLLTEFVDTVRLAADGCLTVTLCFRDPFHAVEPQSM